MIVSTSGLTKTYGGHVGLDGVDLAVPDNSVYGLVGPNGAGKTTLLALLAGLRRPTSGGIHVGVERGGWAMCPDTPVFEPWLTAREVLDLAARLAGHHLVAREADRLLADAGLSDAADRRVGGFSRGMTQRLAVAATLVTAPRLLILDEPCSALDPVGRVEVLDLVARSAGERTVIFSTHVLADVQRVCDVVGVLHGGRLIYQGALADLLRQYSPPVWRIQLTASAADTVRVLKANPDVRSVTEISPGVLRVELPAAADAVSPAVLHDLTRTGTTVRAITPEEPDLEAVFLAMTAAQSDRTRP